MSFTSKRPKGLHSFTSATMGETNWQYTAPTTGQTVQVATYLANSKAIILDCGNYKTSRITAQCLQGVFNDLLGSKDIIYVVSQVKGETTLHRHVHSVGEASRQHWPLVWNELIPIEQFKYQGGPANAVNG